MRTSDVDILMVPGWGDSEPDHWQSRWQRHLRTASRVEQASWDSPDREAWVEAVVVSARRRQRPTVLVGHSLGVATIALAAARLTGSPVAGAFLVGPADLDAVARWPLPEGVAAWPAGIAGFGTMPDQPLPFPSRLVASSDDPLCSIGRAKEIAAAWGSDLSILANAGHINAAAGYGPWPDGLLTFGMFLRGLG